MPKLPKSIIAKYGISKRAWEVFRSSRKKARSNPGGGKTRMVKRKGNPGRKRRWFRGRKGGKRDRRIPLAPTVGFALPLLFGSSGGWTSPAECITRYNRPDLAIQSAVRNLTGMKIGMPNSGFTSGVAIDFGRLLNPLDFGEAPALKGLIWGSIIDIAASKFGINARMKKIPFIGNKVKI